MIPRRSGPVNASLHDRKPSMLRICRCNAASLVLFAFWAAELSGALPDAALVADPAYWIGQAQERLRADDREGALKFFQRASWESPQASLLHYNMAVLAESLGRIEEAVEHYEVYLRWEPRAPDRETLRGRTFRLCGQMGSRAFANQEYRQAQDWFERARVLYPQSRSVQFNLGRVYEALGDWEAAVSSFKEYCASSREEEKGPIRKLIANLLVYGGRKRLVDGDDAGALSNFEEAGRWAPGDPRLLLYRAQCEEKLGLLLKARDHYIDTLKVAMGRDEREDVRKRITEISAELGEHELTRGDLSRAKAVLATGLENSPQDSRLHALQADLYSRTGQTDLAVEHLEKALQAADLQPTNRILYEQRIVQSSIALATQAFQAKDYRRARAYLDKAALWRPREPVIVCNLARVQEAQNQIEEAVSSYRLFLSLAPEMPERDEIQRRIAYLCGLLGSEHFRRGNYAQAQEAFEQALLMHPEEPALLYNLAMVLLKREQTQQAVDLLERYLTQERDPKEVERVRGQLAHIRTNAEKTALRNRRETVRSALEQSAGSAPNTTNPLLQRQTALFLTQTGRWQDALEQYEAHGAAFPGALREERLQREIASVYRELGRSSLQEGSPSRALNYLDKAIQWSPSEGEAHRLKGWTFENLGMPEEALEVYEEALRLVTDGPERQETLRKIVGILTGQLQSCLKSEDLSRALEILDRLEPYLGEEERTDWNYQKARMEAALGRPRQALLHSALFLLESPQALSHATVRQELASQLAGNPGLGALLRNPKDAFRRARQAVESGELEQALFCLSVAGMLDVQEPERDVEILQVLQAMDLGRPALSHLLKRAESFRSLPSSSRSSIVASFRKEVMGSYQKGLYEEGLSQIEKMEILKGDPSGDLSFLKAVFLEGLGNRSDAIVHYEEALRMNGQIPGFLKVPLETRLAQVLVEGALERYREGAYLDCLHWLDRAQNLAPNRTDVAFNQGCTYLRMQQPQKALESLSRFLNLDQDSPRSESTRKAVDVLKGQIVKESSIVFDPDGFSVNLVAEIPLSMGRLLASDRLFNRIPLDQETLDLVLLAPFAEQPHSGRISLPERSKPLSSLESN